MGPVVDASMKAFVLRPFRTSRTYRNLTRTGQGVLHVTDDVELLARAAINHWDQPPSLTPCEAVEGFILADACRWYAFKAVEIESAQERTTINCTVVGTGRIRDFFGFNRAKHAVLEAAILATRLSFLPPQQVQKELAHLAVIVQKTAGVQESRAFTLLRDFCQQYWSNDKN